MYGYDPIDRLDVFKAEREHEVADLLREREYHRAFQPETLEAVVAIPSTSRLPVWRRLAQTLHLPLPKAAPRSA